jgi:hypothetical protein
MLHVRPVINNGLFWKVYVSNIVFLQSAALEWRQVFLFLTEGVGEYILWMGIAVTNSISYG